MHSIKYLLFGGTGWQVQGCIQGVEGELIPVARAGWRAGSAIANFAKAIESVSCTVIKFLSGRDGLG